MGGSIGLHCTLELTEAVTVLTRLNPIKSDRISTQRKDGLIMFHFLVEESQGTVGFWVSVSFLREAAPKRLCIL